MRGFLDGVDIASNNAGAIASIENTNTGAFSPSVQGDLADAGRNLLIFINGSTIPLRMALRGPRSTGSFSRPRAATDTTVIAFSWPSLGQIVSFPVLDADYRHDQFMATQSGLHLMTFFANLEPLLRAARANGNRTYLLAHSMGNLSLQSAVESWFLHGNGNAALFDVSILAAADCSFDVFGLPNLAGSSRPSVAQPAYIDLLQCQ